MCGLGIHEFGDLVMTPTYMPDTDSREFLNAVSTGTHKGEFASLPTGFWKHSPSRKHGGANPRSLSGQREALVSSWLQLSLTLCVFLTFDSGFIFGSFCKSEFLTLGTCSAFQPCCPQSSSVATVFLLILKLDNLDFVSHYLYREWSHVFLLLLLHSLCSSYLSYLHCSSVFDISKV